MQRSLFLTLAFAFAALAGGACAQTMYKCVGADGKTSYGDQPCSGKVAAKKEIDVRANLDDVERANRKKLEKELRAQETGEYDSRRASLGAEAQAKKIEKDLKLMEGSELDRRLDAYEQMKIETQKRVKADEEARVEASRLWHCRRGKEPEKCQ